MHRDVLAIWEIRLHGEQATVGLIPDEHGGGVGGTMNARFRNPPSY
jgi:hypothetical protein